MRNYENKPITPKVHGLTDYALVPSLLIAPRLFGFNNKIKKIYTAEALILLVYVALTDHPTAVKPLIPFTTHGKIDPFNVGQFAMQSMLTLFRKDKKALIFNLLFTLTAGIIVALTNWHGNTKMNQRESDDTLHSI